MTSLRWLLFVGFHAMVPKKPLRQPSIQEIFKKVDGNVGTSKSSKDAELKMEDEVLSCDETEACSSNSTTPDLSPSVCGGDGAPTWFGTPISDLKKSDILEYGEEPIKASHAHTVLFKLPHRHGEKIQPYPTDFKDKWDTKHVRMPCSSQSLYPVDDQLGKRIESKWDMILKELSKPIRNSLDLEEAIRAYNIRQAKKWNFTGMHTFFTDVLDTEECLAFFNNTLPRIVDLVLRLPSLCTRPIPLLLKGQSHSVSLSQLQVASLLANAFFCTYPLRNSTSSKSEYYNFPAINFASLFSARVKPFEGFRAEKLKFLINYFRRVTQKEPIGTVTFKRQCLRKFPDWETSEQNLPQFHVTSEGTIEKNGVGMLQLDFANKFLGGGVLRHGSVQEEIRFLACPELIVSMLITESLDANECLIMTGAEQYSSYSGYGKTLRWGGDYIDDTPRDCHGRIQTEIVAIDAVPFGQAELQYKPNLMKRDLNKAFCGFFSDSPHKPSAVATGNWGCGAFRGSPKLKALLQLMAAAEARRDVLYITFGDKELCREIHSMYQYLTRRDIKIKTIWQILQLYHGRCCTHKKPSMDLYEFIYDELATYDADTDVDSPPTVAM